MAIPFLAQTIFKDNVKLVFGDGLDLQIYHDGSNSRIGDAGTGNLIISGTNLHLTDAATGEYFFRGTSNGAVQLYYDGTEKFITTSTGIDVTGTVNLDNLTINSAQGTDGQVLTSTGTGIAWEDIASETAERIEVTVKNVSGGSLSKGTVVHASPSATPPSGNVIEVIAADYDDSTKMPAIGILNETIADTAEGSAVMMGAVSGIDTSSFSIGDELYVGNLGTLTNTKPATSGQLIQKIAVVIKSHASNGLIKIFGAGRSNDVPLPLYIDNTNQRVGIGDSTPSYTLDVNGTIYGSAVRSGRYYGTSGTSSYLDLDSGAPYSLLASSEVNVTNSIICNDLEATEVGGIAASNGPVYGLRFYGYGNTTYYVDPNDSTTSAILNGKVGIGTTSPDKKLHISSTNAAITNPLSVGNALRFTDDDPTQNNGQITGTIEWETKDSNSAGVQSYITTVSTNTGLGNLAFGTGAGGSATERMRLDSSGNVSIGESSARNARLLLNNAGSQGAPQLMLIDSGDSGKQSEIRFDSGNLIFDYWGGSSRSERMRIGPAGQIGIGGANYGTSGQVLTSNGSGSAPSWQNAGAGSSNWTLSGNDIYNNNSGNVGIGTTTPSEKLDVSGTIQSSANEGKIIINSTATNGKEYQLISIDTGNLGLFDGTAYRLWVSGSGSVGIGTTSPSAKLHVAAASGDGLKIITSDVSTIKMGSTTGATSYWGFATTNLAASDFGIYQSNSTGGDPITAGTPRLYFSSIGNIGVGTSSPINGGGNAKWITIDATSANSYSGGIVYSIGGSGKAYHYVENDYLIHQGQSNVGHKFVTNGTTERLRIGSAGQIGIGGANYGTSGQVLTSNGSGSAPSWQDASGSSNWTLSGNDIYNNNSGNVGIGTSSPGSKLHIQNSAGGSGGYLKITDVTYGGDVRFGMADGVNNDVILGSWTNNSILFYTNTAERVRITNTGNVGIGTTSPTTGKLVVHSGDIEVRDSTGNSGGRIKSYDDHHAIYFREGGNNQINYYEYGGNVSAGGGHRFFTGGTKPNQTLKVHIGDDYTQINNSVRSPIFYDSNNTAYYTNPAGTSSLEKLQVDGLFGSSVRRITNPGGATYLTTTSSVTGGLLIQLPTARRGSNTMMQMTINVYQYNTGRSFQLRVGGYNYNNTNSWVNVFAYLIGDQSFPQPLNVRFGDDGTRNWIMIGETNTVWPYPQFQVTDFQAGYSGVSESWSDGWATSIVTSIPAGHDETRVASSALTSNNASNWSTDLYAPIYYDSNNTGRYIDPSSTSRINRLEIENTSDQSTPTAYMQIGSDGFQFGGNNNGYEINSAQISAGYHTANSLNFVGMGTVSTNRRMDFWAEGGFFVSGDIYDKDYTSYYLSPGGSSRLHSIVVGDGTPDTTPDGTTFSNTIKSTNGSNRVVNFEGAGNSISTWYTVGNTAYGAIDQGPSYMSFWQNQGLGWNEQFRIYRGYQQSLNSLRSPIFYDSNDTGFYLNPADSASRLGGIFFGKANNDRNGMVPVALNDGQLLFRTNTDYNHKMWYYDGLNFSTNPSHGHIRFWADSSSRTNSTGGTTLVLDSDCQNVYTTIYGSTRSPIFYDSDNTAYYADPGGTSQFNGLTVTNTINGSISGANAVNITGYGNGNFTFNQSSGSFGPYSGWHNYFIGNHGNGSNYYNTIIAMPFWGSPRYSRLENNNLRGPFEFWTSEIAINSSQNITAPIYYDYNNTGYYTDPAGTSNIQKLIVNTYGSGVSRQLTIKEDGDTDNSMGNYPGAWTSALNIQSNDNSTYLWLSPLTSNIPRVQTNYGQLDFYTGNNTNRALHLSGTTARSSTFYDIDNTAYYVNPAGASVLDRIVVGDGSTSSGGTALRVEDTFTGNNTHRIMEVKADQGTVYAYGAKAARFYNVAYGGGAIEFYRPSQYGPDTNAVAFVTGSTTVGSISMTGSATSYNTTSDYRLKENIIDITDGTERVKQLKPRRFNFIEDPDNTVDGFIAHEADLIVPESVTGEKDEVYPNGEPVYQSMDNAKLVPVLTAALQEAIAKIEDLETRIQILENQ